MVGLLRVAKWVQVSAIKPDDRSLSPSIHRVEGEHRFSNIKVTRADVSCKLSGFLDLRLLPALVIRVFIRLLECVRQRQELQCSQLCEKYLSPLLTFAPQ